MRVGCILLLNLFTVLAHAFSVTDLEAERRKIGAPGLGAAIIKPQSVEVWTTGVRRVGNDTKILNTDKFHLGSNTKALTATLLAQLIEGGSLRWDSTLQEIFPELALRAEFLNVTVEMLAAHRSGITSNMGAVESGQLWSWMWQNNFTPTLSPKESHRYEIARRLLAFPAQHKPGQRYLYSNWNYLIIGAVLEKYSNASWEDLMEQKIFAPLNMSSCSFGAAGNSALATPDQPWPHVFKNGVFTPLASTDALDNPQSFGPAGTVHCSLGDWGKFLQAHLNGFQQRNTPILQTASFVKLHTAYPGQEYTPGGWLRIVKQNQIVLQHTGSNTMNYANVWLVPAEDIGFAATTNAGDPGRAMFDFTESVIGDLVDSLGGL
jgi:CubicO group peptidase (beta-lactamase class C family)